MIALNDAIEPAVGPTDALRARLIEHGLARHLTWIQAAELLDLHLSAAPARVEDAMADLQLVLDQVVWTGRSLPNEPVKIAYYVWFGEIVTGEKKENLYPKFWGEASPKEAFLCKLHPTENPGDHSGIKTLTREALREELQVAATMPLTRWMRERIRRVTAEANARRNRRI